MKQTAIRLGCWLLATALGVGATPALAQSTYVEVDYMKVAPGKGDAYVDLERNVWKPYHQALVDAGRRAAWALYGVRSPSDSGADYNYVTVNVYGRFTDMENPYAGDILAQVHADKDLPTLFAEALAARDLVRSETWQLLDRVPEGGPLKAARYEVVNYMKVPADGGVAYLAVEQELWKPLHESRVTDGHAAGWSLYTLRFPSDAALDYNYATVDSYAEFGDLENPVTLEMFKKVHPSADGAFLDAMLDRTGAVRQTVRAELWELLETTDPPAAAR